MSGGRAELVCKTTVCISVVFISDFQVLALFISEYVPSRAWHLAVTKFCLMASKSHCFTLISHNPGFFSPFFFFEVTFPPYLIFTGEWLWQYLFFFFLVRQVSTVIAVVLDNKFKVCLIYRGSVSDSWHRERLPYSLRLCSGPCSICGTYYCCKKWVHEAAWDVLDLPVTGVRFSKHNMNFIGMILKMYERIGKWEKRCQFFVRSLFNFYWGIYLSTNKLKVPV